MQTDAAIIGGGPAGLMAAEVLARTSARVTVFDAMPSVGRKFLMAGRGGLNLTHSEPLPGFLSRYREAEMSLAHAIEAFPPRALCEWSAALGEPTFVGSSRRVFPKSFKASPLLRAWLLRLSSLGVEFAPRHRWTGWDASGALKFSKPDGEIVVKPRVTVLAMGGASWPRLGSDGAWTGLLKEQGVAITSLRASNCGFDIAWSEHFASRFAGQALKGVVLRFGGEHARGEVMITQRGIEGGAVYALSAPLREAILAHGYARVEISLRSDLSPQALDEKLSRPRGTQSISNFVRKAIGLSPVEVALLHEAAIAEGKPLSAMAPPDLAALIAAVPIRLTGIAPIGRAISTAGGVRFDELDETFMLKRMPGVFVAGEMLDWEAPTGGYLLQASFATGAAAGRGASKWIG